LKKTFVWFLCTLIGFGLFSCRSRPEISPQLAPPSIIPSTLPPEAGFEEGAVLVSMKAGARLNTYDGSPHAVLACMYQLPENEPFERLMQDETGLRTLLKCDVILPGLPAPKQFIVQPGQEVEYKLNRFEGTRFVGIVIGFHSLTSESSARLFEIPVLQVNTGDPGHPVLFRLDKLHIQLTLGSQGIQ
jgi:predicted component of type VI protein secretion system